MPKNTVLGGHSNEGLDSTAQVEAPAEPGDAGSSPGSEYADWTNADLQDELEERGLPKSGNKAELIARLEEDDAAPAEAE